MNNARSTSDAAAPAEQDVPVALGDTARRASRTRAQIVRSRFVPAAVSVALLATAGGFALNLNANEVTTAAAPVPEREEDVTSRSAAREVVEEAPAAEASATFVSGSWSDSYGQPAGDKFVQLRASVRAAASQNSELLGKVQPGDKISVTDKVENGYRQVNYDGRLAWVSDTRLGDTAPAPKVEKKAEPVKTEAPKAEPKKAEAPKVEKKAEPEKTATAKAEPKKTAKAEPKKAETAKAATAKAEPKKTASSKAENKTATAKAASSDTYTGSSSYSGATVLGLKPKAMVVYNAVTAKWSFSSIGGYRAGNNLSNHGRGGAIDFMITPGKDSAKGWAVANYLAQNMDALGLDHIMFEQKKYTKYGRKWVAMENRGSTTANHYDHVHVSVAGI